MADAGRGAAWSERMTFKQVTKILLEGGKNKEEMKEAGNLSKRHLMILLLQTNLLPKKKRMNK